MLAELALAGMQAYSAYQASKQSQVGQQNANLDNLAEAERNRQFQVDFYKHRYQWQKEDLISAGYNPLLAVMNGQPPLASGAVSHDIRSTRSEAVRNAIETASVIANIDFLKAQKNKMLSESALLNERTRAEKANADMAEQDADIMTNTWYGRPLAVLNKVLGSAGGFGSGAFLGSLLKGKLNSSTLAKGASSANSRGFAKFEDVS